MSEVGDAEAPTAPLLATVPDAHSGPKSFPLDLGNDGVEDITLERTTSHHSADAAGNGWKATTFILLTDMFGLGALAIPSVFAHLGWLAAGVALLALGLAMLFSGSLFTRLAAAHPDVSVYHRLAGAAYGRRGRWLVFGTVYTLILLSPAVIHLTSAEALGVRSMEDVGWVSVVGTGTMLAAVAVTLGKLLLEPLPERAAAATHWLPPASTTPRLALVALLDVVFAYGGQQARTWLGVNWFRYASTMRKRSNFLLVTRVGAVTMTAFYLLLGCTGYWSLGSAYDLSKPITSVLPQDGWTVLTNAMLLIHCLVAYQININVLTHLVLTVVAKHRAPARSWQGWGAWTLVSGVGVLASWALASGIPFFSLVIALVAAVGDVAAGYLIPALLALRLLPLGRAERWLCRALVPLSVALSAAGIFSAVREIVHDSAAAP
ncbi:hypothetical protein F751_1578 [Auxenochlorella protothecoides]|uniref:Amino acid transporter transmembrane domain-containing protein n=1 Tax=Auxenochlorella protothecoides TaxID=3075 RepID=A0A087STZ8_AUXPR|nr:hypothetical protein F751_1578 [Auxenochlorella protothecoides]KFM29202.1 hypothetical protein F751_1578 [Auxenochlorella protothecoides]